MIKRVGTYESGSTLCNNFANFENISETVSTHSKFYEIYIGLGIMDIQTFFRLLETSLDFRENLSDYFNCGFEVRIQHNILLVECIGETSDQTRQA